MTDNIQPKEMIIEGCNGCPFHNMIYGEALIDDDKHYCNLSENLVLIETNRLGDIITPDWCPMKQQSLLIKFKV